MDVIRILCSIGIEDVRLKKHVGFPFPGSTVDTQNVIPFDINSDASLATMVVPPEQKDTMSFAECRFDAFHKLNLPDLGLQSHKVEKMMVEKAGLRKRKIIECSQEGLFQNRLFF